MNSLMKHPDPNPKKSSLQAASPAENVILLFRWAPDLNRVLVLSWRLILSQ